MTTVDDLTILDRLTDAEVDNLRTAIRQGDLDENAWPATWATVKDSVDQMPEDLLSHYGDPTQVRAALTRVIATEGAGTEIAATYRQAGLL
jgi:hypothetical protein